MLTHAKLSGIVGNLANVTKLSLKGKGITGVEDLSVCPNLITVDLSENEIEDLEFINANRDVKTLKVTNNKLSGAALRALYSMQGLKVLNAGHNSLTRLDVQLPSLNALILNNNKLTASVNVKPYPLLNTLVLSHNNLEEIKGLRSLEHLTKLSISHNSLRQLPDLSHNVKLRELRATHNKLSGLPHSLELLKDLAILEVSHNIIFNTKEIEIVSELKSLRTLNISSNPVCRHPETRVKVHALAQQVTRLLAKSDEVDVETESGPGEQQHGTETPKKSKNQKSTSAQQSHSSKGTKRKGVERDSVERGDGDGGEVSKKSKATNTTAPEETLKSGVRKVVVVKQNKDEQLKSLTEAVREVGEIGEGGVSAWD